MKHEAKIIGSGLPIESKISLASFFKHLTLANILTGLVIFIVFFLLRNFVFTELSYFINIKILEDIPLEFHVNKDLLLGIWAVISQFSLKGFIENLLEVFSPEKQFIGHEKLPFILNQDAISESKEDSKQSTELTNNKAEGEIKYNFMVEIRKEFNKFTSEMEECTQMLHDRQIHFDREQLRLDEPEVVKYLAAVLREQTRCLNASLLMRMEWVNVTNVSLPQDIQDEMSTCEKNIMRLQSNNVKNIVEIAKLSEEKKQVKEYFDLFNSYRNNVKKEITKLETLSRDGFRINRPSLYKNKEFKLIINVEGPNVIKKFDEQDGYIKRKISEIVNAKKN